jgi:DNA (cytosine-5)-methyltransferase 1
MRGDALSLFSGAGGFDLGAHLAGLKVRLATDKSDSALRTLGSAALSEWLLTGDIDSLVADGDLRYAWGDGAPRILFGGPPCTGFSHAGFWIDEKRNGQDPAVHLVQRYLDAVSEFEPEAFVLENVPGLAFKTHEHHLSGIVNRARRLGYRVSVRILNSQDFSVAQARRRLFIVGCKTEKVHLTEWPTFPYRSSAWAIGSLETGAKVEPDEELRGEYAALLRRVPIGGNYIHFTDRGAGETRFKYRGRYWSFLLKAHPDFACPTIPAQRVTFNGPFHWSSRHLRLPELARLQGFPDGFPWSSNLHLARIQIGNAVPPLLGAAVMWKVRETLGDVPRGTLPETLMIAQQQETTYEQLSAAMVINGAD